MTIESVFIYGLLVPAAMLVWFVCLGGIFSVLVGGKKVSDGTSNDALAHLKETINAAAGSDDRSKT